MAYDPVWWREKRKDAEWKQKRVQYHKAFIEKRKAAGLCIKCGKGVPANGSFSCTSCLDKSKKGYRKFWDENRERINQKARISSRKARRAARQEAINAYGGKCECCGETAFEFLTIDHINGDGAEERRRLKKCSITFYRYLKKLGYPKDRYRLLCLNCNFSIGHWGYCPHDKDRRIADE